MPTATEKARGALTFSGVTPPGTRPTIRTVPTPKRYPDATPATGREPAAIARAIKNLGGKGARR